MMELAIIGTVLGFMATGALVAIAVGISMIHDELMEKNINDKFKNK